MRVSSARFVRSLAAKLHPPGPVTQRESQQLLRALDGAFRKRLDEEHPSPTSTVLKDPMDGPLNTNRSASMHLDYILQHPLLHAHDSGPVASKAPGALHTFDKLIRENSMHMDALRDVADTYILETRHKRQLEQPRLAPGLAAWMAAAPAEQRRQFFLTAETMRSVVRVMFRDGAGEVVWEWLRLLHAFRQESCAENRGQPQRWWLNSEDNFVSAMISSSLNRNSGTSAVQQLVAANAHRAGLPKPVPLVAAWNRLSSFVFSMRRKHGISAQHYEQLLNQCPDSMKTDKPYFSRGFLTIYSPTGPTATMLYRELQSAAYVANWAKLKWRKPAKLQRLVLRTILDASELALEQGEAKQARFFLEFAQTHFPDIISRTGPEASVEPAKRLHQAREELENHRVPDALAGIQPAFG